MEFGSALRVLLRRWLIILVGAVITLGAAAFVYTSTPPTYRATAELLLLLPTQAGDEERETSPFLYLPNELNVLARVVAAAPQSRSFEEDLESRGLTSPYEVGLDPGTPIISVGVEGPDAEDVLATRDALVDGIQAELIQVQRGEDVPTRQIARTRVFAAENTPAELGGSATRGVLAVIAAGGLLTLLAAFGIDQLAAARSRPSTRR